VLLFTKRLIKLAFCACREEMIDSRTNDLRYEVFFQLCERKHLIGEYFIFHSLLLYGTHYLLRLIFLKKICCKYDNDTFLCEGRPPQYFPVFQVIFVIFFE
jgi:hypothetical protein